MNKIKFWSKTSTYSILICACILIIKMLFESYLGSNINIVLILGGIALIIFFFSEIMKFILKRINNEK